MGSDSTLRKGSAVVLPKDMGKKKKVNRSARLKRHKLDARREQWLSQVKSRGGKDSLVAGSPPSPLPPCRAHPDALHNLESRTRTDDSDLEYLVNSTGVSHDKDRDGVNGSSSSGSYSGSVTDEEDENSLDDWEAMADALNSEYPTPTEPPLCRTRYPVPSTKHAEAIPRGAPSCHAWRPDDAFRPQSLPNLANQHSLSGNSGHFSGKPATWARVRMTPPPSSCPICCEDLDVTDSSFFPCPCGFRLCLFCHKRILEDDGRCPGCRKPYGPVEGDLSVGVNVGALSFRLPRACSMGRRC